MNELVLLPIFMNSLGRNRSFLGFRICNVGLFLKNKDKIIRDKDLQCLKKKGNRSPQKFSFIYAVHKARMREPKAMNLDFSASQIYTCFLQHKGIITLILEIRKLILGEVK